MKKLILSIGILVAAFSSVSAQKMEEETSTITKVGDNLPSFTFELSADKKVNIEDYKGKVILINLFATWCPPCNAELPEVEKQIWKKHKDDSSFELFVFGREENWEKLNGFKAKKAFTFPILPDLDRSIFSKFASKFIPRNILIDKKGKIIYQSVGYSPEEFSKLTKLIDKAIKE